MCDDADEEDEDGDLEAADEEEEFRDGGGVAVGWYAHCAWWIVRFGCRN